MQAVPLPISIRKSENLKPMACFKLSILLLNTNLSLKRELTYSTNYSKYLSIIELSSPGEFLSKKAMSCLKIVTNKVLLLRN